MRNLPGALAGAALHPPVVPAGAVPALQDDPEHGGIGLGGELTLPRVAAGLRIARVEPNTVGGGLGTTGIR
jgi:acetaldehyde dehydrogenase (acetylating)